MSWDKLFDGSDPFLLPDDHTNPIPAMMRNGTYFAVMRVNGRAVMGLGHTPAESQDNTWQAARDKWPQYETVFDYLQSAGYQPEVSA